jgi:hypothetical protein
VQHKYSVANRLSYLDVGAAAELGQESQVSVCGESERNRQLLEADGERVTGDDDLVCLPSLQRTRQHGQSLGDVWVSVEHSILEEHNSQYRQHFFYGDLAVEQEPKNVPHKF